MAFLFVSSLYMSLPLGFDLFFHIFSYQPSPEFGLSLNRGHYIFGEEVPRYLFLSGIYSLSSLLGFPIFWCAVIIVAVPFYFLINEMFVNRKTIFVSDYILLLSVFIFMVFYSALSVSIIWVLVFLYTRKPIFGFGIFHPAALLFLPLLISHFRFKFRYLLSCCFLLFVLLYFSSSGGRQSMALPVVVEFHNIVDIVILVLELKYKEFAFVLSLAVFLFIFRRTRVPRIRVMSVFLILFCSVFISIPINHERSMKHFLLDGRSYVFQKIVSGSIRSDDYATFSSLRE